MVKKVLFIIAQQNFRDEEYLIPKQLLEEQGIEVTTTSITADEARGMIKAKVKPDIAVRDANPNDFDCLIIAGGSGSPKLVDYPEVLNIIRRFDEKSKPIAAICLAGYVLAKAGVLKGKTATVFPADFALVEYRRNGVIYSNKPVVVDGRFVTAEGPENARDFAEEVINLLTK